MTKEEKLESVLKSYERYYTIKKEDVTAPFAAEAEFKSHNEQYILVKSAKISEMDSNEFVYFAAEDTLTLDKLYKLDKIAWETGLSKVVPKSGHRNSDVVLVIIADRIEEDAFEAIKKLKHSKSYFFTIYGWSNYKLVAIDLSKNASASNRQGRDLKKIINNK